MKTQVDLKRQNENYEVGDKLFLKIRPYRQHSLAKGGDETLVVEFYGPFDIIQKVGKLPTNSNYLILRKCTPLFMFPNSVVQ